MVQGDGIGSNCSLQDDGGGGGGGDCRCSGHRVVPIAVVDVRGGGVSVVAHG